MRYLIIALALLLGPSLSARAQLSVDIGGAGFNIGINMPVYPQLVRIPGYPVYYDPYVSSNYFFYDGLYWAYVGDSWYASTWYNGPWDLVEPEYVPQFLLLVPVRYYRSPPVYFGSWYRDAPPRWGEHWGRSWEQRRSGWDRWDRRSVPAAAPLPVYQRQYSGSRYPRAVEQQQTIQSQNYRYQPRDAVAQQHFHQRAAQGQGQPQGNAGRPRAQTPQPVQQGSAPQPDQQRARVDRQRQPQQVPQPQPDQQRARVDRQQQQVQQQQQQQQQQQPSTQGPTQRMRQERPAQSAVQTQRMQNGPQERGSGNAGSPQARGPETRSAPRETRAAPQPPGPQAKSPENAGPQGRGAENRGGPQQDRGGAQGKGGDKGAREGKVKEDKKE